MKMMSLTVRPRFLTERPKSPPQKPAHVGQVLLAERLVQAVLGLHRRLRLGGDRFLREEGPSRHHVHYEKRQCRHKEGRDGRRHEPLADVFQHKYSPPAWKCTTADYNKRTMIVQAPACEWGYPAGNASVASRLYVPVKGGKHPPGNAYWRLSFQARIPPRRQATMAPPSPTATRLQKLRESQRRE